MCTQAALLRFTRAVLVEIIKPGLAKRPRPWDAAASLLQPIRGPPLLHRPDADGCRRSNRDVWKSLCYCSNSFRRLTRVEMGRTMRPIPVRLALATMPSRSSAKSGKSRWEWLSTSIKPYPFQATVLYVTAEVVRQIAIFGAARRCRTRRRNCWDSLAMPASRARLCQPRRSGTH